MEYIYLLKEREFIKTNEDIYKIGKTKQENLKRFNSYPKGSILIFQIVCSNCSDIENKLIKLFRAKYIKRKDIGNEYFEGDYITMIDDIIKTVNSDLRQNNIFKNKNIYKSIFNKISDENDSSDESNELHKSNELDKSNESNELVKINKLNKSNEPNKYLLEYNIKYYCKYCNKSYHNKSNLNKHNNTIKCKIKKKIFEKT